MSASPSVTVKASQLQQFVQLQQLVVSLSQQTVEEKKVMNDLQRRLEQYATLTCDQDEMIEELKRMNRKLQSERDTLAMYKDMASTPADEFTRSLISQLKEEKRQRLELEEQSNHMVAEQQRTINRLEARLKESQAVPRDRAPSKAVTTPIRMTAADVDSMVKGWQATATQ